MTDTYDVAILGGGLAGLTLALQLKLERPNTSILVLERLTHPVPEAAFKVGESSVEIGAHYFTEVLKIGKHFETEQLPKFGLRFFFNNKNYDCISSGLEMGLSEFFPKPSFQLDRGRLENHLVDTIKKHDIHFLDRSKVSQIDLQHQDKTHKVTFARNGDVSGILCRWVIDASGRAGILKKKLGLHEPVEHKIQAAWFRVGAKIQIDDWCKTEEWQKVRGEVKHRWLSTNHLMGRGYWVWIIPLSSGNTSIGIVTDPRFHPLSTYNQMDKALDFLREHEPQCAAAIEAHTDHILDFKALKNVAYGCKQVFSTDRWALTGEAGVFLDPFYSPGSDFIAISNSFITQLILRDLAGKSITSQVGIYEKLYQSMFKGTLDIYIDKYQIFGNMQIMPLKILWDYAVYWAHPAFLFIHQRLWDLGIFIHIRNALQKITQINIKMQLFFTEMNEKVNQPLTEKFLDQTNIQLLYELNKGLMEAIDRETFIKTYLENADKLERLAKEIETKVRQAAASGAALQEAPLLEEPLYLEKILPALNL